MGFFGITVSNGIQFTGLQYSSVGNMTLISTTAPVITVILARIFLNERLNLIQIIGIISIPAIHSGRNCYVFPMTSPVCIYSGIR